MVLSATFGLSDVTAKVIGLISPSGKLSFTANKATFSTPVFDNPKTLVLILSYNNHGQAVNVYKENDPVSLDLEGTHPKHYGTTDLTDPTKI